MTGVSQGLGAIFSQTILFQRTEGFSIYSPVKICPFLFFFSVALELFMINENRDGSIFWATFLARFKNFPEGKMIFSWWIHIGNIFPKILGHHTLLYHFRVSSYALILFILLNLLFNLVRESNC